MHLRLSTTLPIGIDISERSLKAVQLIRRRGELRLAALSHLPVPSQLISPEGIADISKAANVINKLLQKPQYGSFSGSLAVTCLPETKTFCVRGPVSFQPTGMENEVVKLLEKNIPYPAEDLNYDWEVLSRRGAAADVIAGAVQQSIADSYAELLAAADLTPVALEIEPVAIARSLFNHANPPKETVGIVDIGATRSSFSVHQDGAPLATVSLPISGIATTAAVAKKLKTTDEKAEGAKLVCGLNKDCAGGEVAAALKKMIDSLIIKIKETLVYLEEHQPNYKPPQVLFLCGGGASIKDLHKIMTEQLNVATHPGNVFQNIQVPASVAREHFQSEVTTLKKFSAEPTHVQDNSLRFATAIGLALRGAYHTDM